MTHPTDFKLVLGEGGGFTGLWQGYTINSDGSVLEWSGAYAEDVLEPFGTLSSDQMGELWRHVQEADYFDQDKGEVGNMTAFMDLQADSANHRISWQPRVLNKTNEGIPGLYAYTKQLVRDAKIEK